MNDATHPASHLVAPRILVIDDNEAIHQDFLKIFGTSRSRSTPSAAELALFGGGAVLAGAPEFHIDSAYQGQEGLALVRQAQEQQNPYALAFIDVRMPPGWDGIETTARIWQHDPDIQIVICTAYSDYSWSEMLVKLGRSDRLVILKKPFDTIEVMQLASALTEKWRLARQSRSILDDLERRVAERTRELVQAGEQLQASEAQYRLLFDSNPHPMWVYDMETLRFVTVNGAAVEHYGYSEQQFLAMTLRDIRPMEDVAALEKVVDELRERGRTLGLWRHRKQDGSLIDVEISSEVIVFNGRPARLVLAHDVTERKEADAKINRLNRVFAVLSGINSLIVRVHERPELFTEACRVAVEQGNFVMAWIGTFDPATQDVTPVAWAGERAEELSREKASAREDSPRGKGAVGRAIRERRPVINNDMAAQGSGGARRKEILSLGFRSQIALPLFEGQTIVGTLMMYAREPNFFDEAEVSSLTELARNISFALAHISRQQKLDKLARIRAVSGEINAAIARARGKQELLDAACRIAVVQAGFPLAWIGMLDPATRDLKAAAMAGSVLEYGKLLQPSARGDIPAGQGTNGRACREKKPAVENDMVADPNVGSMRKEGLRLGIRAALSLPLLVEGMAVGVMGLYARDKDYFDEEEVSLLTEVAGNISFALEHIGREEKIGRLTRIQAVMSGINALTVRVRERDELFREACRIAVDAGGFRMAWIGVGNSEAGVVELVASASDLPDSLESPPLPVIAHKPVRLGFAERALREKQSMISNDLRNDLERPRREELEARGIRSLAVIPLIVEGEAIGILALYSGDVGFFDDEEMRLLQDLAGDIGFAIDHIEKAEKLNYLAYYDALTGLANRSLFLERVAQYMRSAVGAGHKLAVCLVDLERFKNINDSLGRPAGDTLLRQVAEWLTGNVGDASLLARVGADHFAVVLTAVKQEGDVARLLEKAMEAFQDHPFRLNDGVFRIAAKVGVALFPDDGGDADALFRNAEAALKKAKAGGDRYLFYTQRMTEAVAGKLTLENQLRQALDKEEFVLHYQPKVNLASGKLTSAEALIRWNDPRTGLVPPGRFIPILEETGLIHEVGRWALRKAVAENLRWRAAGLAAVRIAVNVSPLQLRSRGFIAEIEQAIGMDARAAAGLELEITESVIMEDIKHSIASLQAIRATGITIAIDDFGTGFSSLSYLSKLPVDTLKIDRSFVTDMTSGPQGLALVSTIVNLAHSLKLKVVAEGVETEEESRLLRLLRCDEMQGFLFSKPVPGEVFESRFLAAPAVAIA